MEEARKPLVALHRRLTRPDVPQFCELCISDGIVVVHVPGTKMISLRSVKRALGVKQARLASLSKLAELALTPGTVSPVLDPVWSLRHLISSDVLDLEYVTTNNGTHIG